jgi:secondary thiamine-phosphate synthase enzyme
MAAGRVVAVRDDPVEGGRLLIIERARIDVETAGPGFTDITGSVARWLKELNAADGTVLLFMRHTSASLTVQENANPDVRIDLLAALDRLAPSDAGWRHAAEGPDDMPAHVKAMLTTTSLAVPVIEGDLGLGTWQAIYLVEHRRAPHRRETILQFAGTCLDATARLERSGEMGIGDFA